MRLEEALAQGEQVPLEGLIPAPSGGPEGERDFLTILHAVDAQSAGEVSPAVLEEVQLVEGLDDILPEELLANLLFGEIVSGDIHTAGAPVELAGAPLSYISREAGTGTPAPIDAPAAPPDVAFEVLPGEQVPVELAEEQVLVKLAGKQVPVEPAGKQVPVEPAGKQVPGKPAGKQVAGKPVEQQVSLELAEDQLPVESAEKEAIVKLPEGENQPASAARARVKSDGASGPANGAASPEQGAEGDPLVVTETGESHEPGTGAPHEEFTPVELGRSGAGGETAEATEAREFLDVRTKAAERLGDLVAGRSTRGGGHMRIRLHPPELGELHVAVVLRGERVGVRFDVESPSAQAILVRELPGLREVLEGRGFSIDRAEVFLNGGQQDGSPREGPAWGTSGGSAEEAGTEPLDVEGEEGVYALDIEV